MKPRHLVLDTSALIATHAAAKTSSCLIRLDDHSVRERPERDPGRVMCAAPALPGAPVDVAPIRMRWRFAIGHSVLPPGWGLPCAWDAAAESPRLPTRKFSRRALLGYGVRGPWRDFSGDLLPPTFTRRTPAPVGTTRRPGRSGHGPTLRAYDAT